MIVRDPSLMNSTFACAFNSRNMDHVLALYEAGAMLKVDASSKTLTGKNEIAAELSALMKLPGKMVSRNNFCLQQSDIALLRADWALVDQLGNALLSGSTAEVVRRQTDGRWLYVIDHASGASLPSMT